VSGAHVLVIFGEAQQQLERQVALGNLCLRPKFVVSLEMTRKLQHCSCLSGRQHLLHTCVISAFTTVTALMLPISFLLDVAGQPCSIVDCNSRLVRQDMRKDFVFAGDLCSECTRARKRPPEYWVKQQTRVYLATMRKCRKCYNTVKLSDILCDCNSASFDIMPREHLSRRRGTTHHDCFPAYMLSFGTPCHIAPATNSLIRDVS